jgi:hypothetical protein
MKAITKVLCIAAVGCSLVWGQGPTWTTSKIEPYNGYDYELWNQNNSGSVSMKLTGDNGTVANAVGGTFTAQWSGTENVLFRSGKKWGSSSTTTVASLGNAVVNFAATWSSGDNVKMLGIYGWAYYAAGSVPTKDENGTSRTYSNQIEYYIIQDRGNTYNPASQGTNSKKYGSATIDGIAYDFYVCDRIGQAMLTGSGNFKQYFSVPANTNSHRTSGTVTVSKHFEEWIKAGMKMDGPLYEIAMKVESYTGASKNSSGNATVTKNLLTIGGSVPTPSSNSGGGTSSSSGSATTEPQECGEYQTSFCGGLAYGSVLSNSTAMPSVGTCLYIGDFEVIQPALSATVAINGVENTCGADWDNCSYNDKPAAKDGGYYVYVKTGSINSYEDNGWQGIEAKSKPACSTNPIILKTQLSSIKHQNPVYYSLRGEPLGNAKPQKSGVYIVKEGYSAKKIVVK